MQRYVPEFLDFILLSGTAMFVLLRKLGLLLANPNGTENAKMMVYYCTFVVWSETGKSMRPMFFLSPD